MLKFIVEKLSKGSLVSYCGVKIRIEILNIAGSDYVFIQYAAQLL